MTTKNASISPAAGSITPDELARIQHSALLLDVRTPAEFEEAHVAGAVLHPLTELAPSKIAALAKDKSACVVICRSGNRARQAAAKLCASGFEGVRVLDGGLAAWESRGMPLNRGRKTMSLERQVRIAAGALVLSGALLAHLVHPGWIGLSAFVGAGLIFAGITDTCGMGMLIARMPWNNRKPAGSCSSGGCCGN